MPPLMTTTTTLIEHNHCSHKDTKDNNSTRKTCPLSHLYAGEGGQVVGLVTLGDGTSKQEEKSSNVDPENYLSQLFFFIILLIPPMIFRPSLSRGKVAKGLTEEPSLC